MTEDFEFLNAQKFNKTFQIKKKSTKLQYLLSDEDWDGCDGFW